MGGFLSKKSKNDKRKERNKESDRKTPRSGQGARDAENRRRENNVTSNPGREGAGTSAPTQDRGNSEPEKSAGTSSPSGNEGTTAQGQENNTAKGKKEPERRDENSSSPSGDNAKQEDTKTKIKPPPSSAALPEGRESEGTSTSSHNQETTEPENPASPSSESLIKGGKEDQAPTTTPENGGEKSRDKKATTKPAPISGSQGKGDTTTQGQENSTATEENRGGGKPSSSGKHEQLNGDTKRKPTTTSGALPKRRENGGATSTSSHNKITTEPENPASPSSESLIEGGKEDKAPSTTPEDGGEKSRDKDGAGEAAPTSGTRGNGDTTAQGQENNTTTEEKRGGRKPSSSQSGEHAQLKARTGVTVTSTPGPGDPGTSTPTSHDLETTKPGEMSDPSSLRTTQHRSGEKTSSDHGQDPTTRIPDSVPPPQPQGGVRGHRSVIPPRNRKRTATGAETEPREQTRAVIFSLEEDDGVKSLEKWTRSFIPDCQHISPTTTKDWRAAVETSAIVIVYSSSSYRSFTEKMGPFMDHWKGYEKVMVVIGDVPASEDAVRSGWDGGQWPRCEVHVFTKTERRWILQDPRLQKMSGKIREIREIVLRDYQKMTVKNRRVVTIFVGITPLKKAHWLEPLLRDDEKVDFRVSLISEIKDLLSKWREPGLTCILHFPKGTFQKNITKENSVLRLMMEQKGKKPLSVVVVVDDLDDESSEKHLRALYNKSEYSRLGPLFLFRREERGPEYLDYVSSYGEVEVTAKEKWCKLQESMETRLRRPQSCDTPDATPRPPQDAGEEGTRTTRKLGVVGIFSRSSNTDYSWMETVLKSPDLAPVVSEVRPFYISNNQTKRFFKELGRCSFGILYHTKNRGSVNVTDVADSLYDEELEAMSQILNRENVIVVIDDLRDSDIREKRRILATQPSIDRYAFDLLLFSEREKKDGDHEERLTEAIMSLAAGRKTAVKKDAFRPSYTR